jgi:hypothetical protein
LPTYGRSARFNKDFASLGPAEKAKFRSAVRGFVEDLAAGRRFRKGLRVKGVKGAKNIFEMTWGDDGRATFMYGQEQIEGQPHIIWRRVGTHDILDRP